MIKNTKGLSMIVSVLLIIVLVLVATGIVWVVVRGVLQTGAGQFELSSKCLEINIETKKLINTSQTGDYDVTLHRSAGGDEIGGVKLAFFNDTSNSDVTDFGAALSVLGTETKSLSTGIVNVNKIEFTVYLLDDSGEEQICPQTSTYTL